MCGSVSLLLLFIFFNIVACDRMQIQIKSKNCYFENSAQVYYHIVFFFIKRNIENQALDGNQQKYASFKNQIIETFNGISAKFCMIFFHSGMKFR